MQMYAERKQRTVNCSVRMIRYNKAETDGKYGTGESDKR